MIGNCGDAPFDGTTSGPDLGRPLSYTWYDVTTVPHRIISHESILTIPTGVLPPGPYSLQLGVMTWLGTSSFLTKNVTVVNEAKPMLTLGQYDQVIYPYQELMASVKILPVPSNCVPSTSPVYIFRWRRVGSGGDLSTSKDLYIEAYQLQASPVPYVFQATVYLDQNPGYTNTVSLSVRVISSPLIALLGGNREWNINRQLSIDSVSYDQDISPTKNNKDGLSYSWKCDDLTYSPKDCFNQGTRVASFLDLSNTDVKYLNGSIFLITLTVSKEGHPSTSTSVTITPTSSPIPLLSINPVFNAEQFNPYRRLVLTSTITPQPSNQDDFTYLWTCNVPEIDLSSPSVRNSPDNTSPTLELQSNVLTTTQQYIFTLTITNTTNPNITTSSSITILPVPYPANGKCSVYPTSGIGFQTDFSFACMSWNDKYNPLQYSWKLLPSDSSDEKDAFEFIGYSYQSNLTSRLPNGTKTVIAYIKNKIGSVSTYWITVDVQSIDLMAAGGLFAYSQQLIDSTINPTLRSHNVDRFSQGVLQVLDLLDSTTSTGTSQDLSQRRQLRSNLTDRTRSFLESSDKDGPLQQRLLQIIASISSNPSEIDLQTTKQLLSLLNSTANSLLDPNRTRPSTAPLYGAAISRSIWASLVYVDTVHTNSIIDLATASAYVTYFYQLTRLVTIGLLENAPANTLVTYSEEGISNQRNQRGRILSAYRQAVSQLEKPIIIPGKNDDESINIASQISLGSLSADAQVSMAILQWRDILTQLTGNGNNPNKLPSDFTTSITYFDQDNKELEVNRSNTPLLDFNNPNYNYGSAGNLGHNLLNFSIFHQVDPLRNRSRTCRYWKLAAKVWSTDGTIVDAVNSKEDVTYCLANHATTFGVEFTNFTEYSKPISAPAVSAVSTKNIKNEPATLILIFILFFLFLVALPFVLIKDQHDKDVNRVGAISEAWRLSIKDPSKHPVTYFTALQTNFVQKTVWFGPFGRRFGDRHTSFQRICVLFVMIYWIAGLTAICYGTFSPLNLGSIAAISAIVSLTIAFIIQYWFTHSESESLFTHVLRTDRSGKYAQQENVERKLRLLDKDYALSRNRLSSFWKIAAYNILFAILVISIVVLILYGVRFSYNRDGLSSNQVSWKPVSGQQFNGPILRESFDTLSECQLSCIGLWGCNGVSIRSTDGKCYEMSGDLVAAQATWYANAFVMKDERVPVYMWWLRSFFLAVWLTIFFEFFLVFIFVTLVWLIYNGPNWNMVITAKEVPQQAKAQGGGGGGGGEIEIPELKAREPPSELEPASFLSNKSEMEQKEQEERVARANVPIPRDSRLTIEQARVLLADIKDLQEQKLITDDVAEKRQKEIVALIRSSQRIAEREKEKEKAAAEAAKTPPGQVSIDMDPHETDYVIEEQLPEEGMGGPPALEKHGDVPQATVIHEVPTQTDRDVPALEPSWGRFVPADIAPPPLENADPVYLDTSEGAVELSDEVEGENDMKYGPVSQTSTPQRIDNSQIMSPSASVTPIRGGVKATVRKGDLPVILKNLSSRGIDVHTGAYRGARGGPEGGRRISSVARLQQQLDEEEEDSPVGTPSRDTRSLQSGPPTPNTPVLPNQVGRQISSPIMETDEY